jgi:hypothetical protein
LKQLYGDREFVRFESGQVVGNRAL